MGQFFFWIRTPTKQKLPYRPSKIAEEIRKTVKVTFLYLLRKHAGKDINCLVTNVSVTVTCLIYYVFFFWSPWLSVREGTRKRKPSYVSGCSGISGKAAVQKRLLNTTNELKQLPWSLRKVFKNLTLPLLSFVFCCLFFLFSIRSFLSFSV